MLFFDYYPTICAHILRPATCLSGNETPVLLKGRNLLAGAGAGADTGAGAGVCVAAGGASSHILRRRFFRGAESSDGGASENPKPFFLVDAPRETESNIC